MAIRPQAGDSRTGRYMLWVAAIGLLVGLTVLFQAGTSQRSGIIQSSSNAGHSRVVVQRDRSGHYLAEGAINGQAVIFLVDTGATDVAVSEDTARAFGLDFGPQIVVMTAAGRVNAWQTRLDSVSIGEVSLENVSATITRGPMAEVLLGMSFLKHFSLSQQGEMLTIESGSKL